MRKVCLCLCFCVFCLCLCLSDHQTLMCYDSELRSVLKFKFKFTCAKLAWPPILVVTMEKVCQDQRWRIETIAAAWCGSFMSDDVTSILVGTLYKTMSPQHYNIAWRQTILCQYCNIDIYQYCLTWQHHMFRNILETRPKNELLQSFSSDHNSIGQLLHLLRGNWIALSIL